MENRVVIDSDFCNMIAPGDDVEREMILFCNICKSLEIIPVIHTFVLNEELLTNLAIKELVSEQFIKVFEYKDFLPEEIFKSQYTDTFVDFYKFMNGVDIEKKFESITKQMNYLSADDLFAALGYGETTINKITNKIKKPKKVADENFATNKNRKPSEISDGFF